MQLAGYRSEKEKEKEKEKKVSVGEDVKQEPC